MTTRQGQEAHGCAGDPQETPLLCLQVCVPARPPLQTHFPTCAWRGAPDGLSSPPGPGRQQPQQPLPGICAPKASQGRNPQGRRSEGRGSAGPGGLRAGGLRGPGVCGPGVCGARGSAGPGGLRGPGQDSPGGLPPCTFRQRQQRPKSDALLTAQHLRGKGPLLFKTEHSRKHVIKWLQTLHFRWWVSVT